MQSKSNYENNNIMNGNLRINKFSFAISLFLLSENFPFLRQIAQNSPTNQELSDVHPVNFFNKVSALFNFFYFIYIYLMHAADTKFIQNDN